MALNSLDVTHATNKPPSPNKKKRKLIWSINQMYSRMEMHHICWMAHFISVTYQSYMHEDTLGWDMDNNADFPMVYYIYCCHSELFLSLKKIMPKTHPNLSKGRHLNCFSLVLECSVCLYLITRLDFGDDILDPISLVPKMNKNKTKT